MFDLTGKTAVVTGGGSGIGKAICQTFADQGAHVCVLDISESAAAETAQEIETSGGSAVAFPADVQSSTQLAEVMKAAAARSGHIDILVNNAGISHIGTVENTTEEDFDRVYQVNIKGVFLTTQSAVPFMKEQGGSIINLASIASMIGLGERFAYSMSKGAVLLMTYTAATDLLPYKIRVNAISPARVHTPFVDDYLKTHYPGKEQEMFDTLSATQPIGRMGSPKEIAALALYLASDEAGFVTGSNYPIDGGFTSLFPG